MRGGFDSLWVLLVALAAYLGLGQRTLYGVDGWRNAGFAFCSPAIANTWPRRWFPPAPGENREPGAPDYTGDFLDGFGNHMTVWAVANPLKSGREPASRATALSQVMNDTLLTTGSPSPTKRIARF